MLTLVASGSVSDYSDTSALRSSIAAKANVDAASVSISVAAASVIITATIVVPASTTPAAVQARLSATLGTAAAASAALGIPVESDPSITEDSKAAALAEEASGGGGPPTAAIGGGAAAAILLVVGLIFLYLRKKRTAGSQSAVALTAISLTSTKEKDLESGATRKTPTYSVELTKTPMGLGLRLADDLVTEIQSDSQAARDGRIKVGDRVVTVNGEAPTKAKPSSAILQATVAGTIVKLEFMSESKAVSAETEMGQSSSVSAEPLKARTIKPLKVRIIKLVRTQPGETFGFGVVGKTTTMLAVSSVDAGGLAEAAGLQLDDCILTINGFKVADREQMSELLSSLAPGEVCTIKVTRVHPFGRSQSSSVSVDPSVSASPSKAQTAPGAELTRDLQKMRRAAELLESWKLDPSELVHGDKIGAGGQADVYAGRWQVSSRASAHLPTGGSLLS